MKETKNIPIIIDFKGIKQIYRKGADNFFSGKDIYKELAKLLLNILNRKKILDIYKFLNTFSYQKEFI